MTRYILTRLGQALLVVFAAYTIAFFLLYVLPSDPVSLMLGTDAAGVTEEQRAQLARQYGFDQPVIVQYLGRLGALFTGDLGYSFQQSRPVTEILAAAIPPTLQLASLGFLVALVFGLGIGLAAAAGRDRWWSQVLLGLPSLGVSIPAFWFGLVLIQLFSFKWRLFPAFNAEGLWGLVLPAITLALPTGAMIAQVFARSLITTQRQAFVTTAWAKGAGPGHVLFRHVTRNALFPVLTITGLVVGQLFSGTVVTETVFSRPGLGRVIATSVTSQDIPVVLGAVIIGAALYTIANLVVDLVYPLIDPRLRASIARGDGRNGRRAATAPEAPFPAGEATAAALTGVDDEATDGEADPATDERTETTSETKEALR
ncbi:ABC transporter permease [Pseudoclavibacter chungangensis]|uniref:ABC transporter permease n=1 Tax=Pseudoclavibacter chungangensis TaxID=587635 RepID=A0A7J5BYI7_9MICO|nr:ABC transporter permease [Pseudoclavibacter chungangensis]KAB1659426.1 ABC transporter permease [Pseudoclavibacter chungangensis]NYJ67726.1 peptide/nickel transport system permease protein [Pseudoclavibacter chungangensis]